MKTWDETKVYMTKLNMNELEEDIHVLSYTMYKLIQALNDVEDMLDEHGDMALQLIFMEDYRALAKDLLSIAEQVELRLQLHKSMSDDLGLPTGIEYARLLKQVANFPKHNKHFAD